MGFFSPKKTEAASFLHDDKTIIQVIRSRVYGKQKGKERESPPFLRPSISFSNLRHNNINARPASHASPVSDAPKRKPLPDIPDASLSVHGQRPKGGTTPASVRNTDTLTLTLAQRLNDLAAANSEGLLNDDEYRLLRQSLFERFATGAAVPTEAPVVPMALRSPRNDNQEHTLTTSNFYIKPPSTPSIRSKTSIGSGVTSLFRRASSRNLDVSSADPSGALSDTASVFSMSSTVSQTFKRRPSFSRAPKRKTSEASLQTESSRAPHDTLSIASRSIPRKGLSEHNMPSTLSLSRSLRRLGPSSPPSSFPGRNSTADLKHIPSSHVVFESGNLTTAAEIRNEIESVQAEGARLLDAFNGLELTTLTRKNNRPGDRSNREGRDAVESTWTLIPDRKPQRRTTDSDCVSIHSSTSAGTTQSGARSAHSTRRAFVQTGSKRDLGTYSLVTGRNVVPVPSLVAPPSQLTAGSSSSINLDKISSHLPTRSLVDGPERARRVPRNEDNADGAVLEPEIADIRRRREEVVARYEARVEYLRAKLKGAELHEKLLRK